MVLIKINCVDHRRGRGERMGREGMEGKRGMPISRKMAVIPVACEGIGRKHIIFYFNKANNQSEKKREKTDK